MDYARRVAIAAFALAVSLGPTRAQDAAAVVSWMGVRPMGRKGVQKPRAAWGRAMATPG